MQMNMDDDDQASRSNTSTPRREMMTKQKNKTKKAGSRSNSNDGGTKSNPNSSPEPSGSKGMEFFFVNESSSTRGKRSHVMKHHIREKRKERSPVSGSPSLTRESGQPTRMVYWRPEAEEEDDGSEGKGKEKETGVGDVVLSGGERSLAFRTGSMGERDVITSPPPIHESPQRCFQTSRSLLTRLLPSSLEVDPFDTLPIAITEDMEQLLSIWGQKMSYWSGKNECIKSSMFKLAISNALAFHAVILSYTARFRDRVAYPDLEPRARLYINTAEHLLAEEMQKPTTNRDEDQIILALSALSLQEERYGDATRATQMTQDAMGRLKHRIGESIAEPFLHYTRLTQAPRRLTAACRDTSEITRLGSFLHDVTTLSTGPLLTISQTPELKGVFQFGSPLHLMLAAGPSPTPVPEDDRRWVIPHDTHEPSRIASLVYIAAALLDKYNSPENIIKLLSRITQRVQQHRLDRFPSTESLMWLLLNDAYNDDGGSSVSGDGDAWRPWFVGHLMEVVNRLPDSLRFQFSEIVLRVLMGREMDLEVSVGKFEGEVKRFLDQSI